MKLEQKTCSLELSKKLKEMGVPQDSYFYWKTAKDYCKLVNDNHDSGYPIGIGKRAKGAEHYSAFTVAELGEMLPQFAAGKFNRGNSFFWKIEIPNFSITIESETEADARAKMLIYLLENKLITI